MITSPETETLRNALGALGTDDVDVYELLNEIDDAGNEVILAAKEIAPLLPPKEAAPLLEALAKLADAEAAHEEYVAENPCVLIPESMSVTHLDEGPPVSATRPSAETMALAEMTQLADDVAVLWRLMHEATGKAFTDLQLGAMIKETLADREEFCERKEALQFADVASRWHRLVALYPVQFEMLSFSERQTYLTCCLYLGDPPPEIARRFPLEPK